MAKVLRVRDGEPFRLEGVNLPPARRFSETGQIRIHSQRLNFEGLRGRVEVFKVVDFWQFDESLNPVEMPAGPIKTGLEPDGKGSVRLAWESAPLIFSMDFYNVDVMAASSIRTQVQYEENKYVGAKTRGVSDEENRDLTIEESDISIDRWKRRENKIEKNLVLPSDPSIFDKLFFTMSFK